MKCFKAHFIVEAQVFMSSFYTVPGEIAQKMRLWFGCIEEVASVLLIKGGRHRPFPSVAGENNVGLVW